MGRTDNVPASSPETGDNDLLRKGAKNKDSHSRTCPFSAGFCKGFKSKEEKLTEGRGPSGPLLWSSSLQKRGGRGWKRTGLWECTGEGGEVRTEI